MIVNNFKNSTTATANPTSSYFKIIIIGDDVRTAHSQREHEEVVLHMREQEILRQQERARKKELEKNKPKEKWYKQFEKHKGFHYRVR